LQPQRHGFSLSQDFNFWKTPAITPLWNQERQDLLAGSAVAVGVADWAVGRAGAGAGAATA
jgi:hypothetical protein